MKNLSALFFYVVPLAIILAVYLRRRARAHAHHTLRLREAIDAGLTEPPSLHPVIDPNRCIGSGGCAKACPESALGIIHGKAQLVDPSVCIGHGACAAACPLEAITLVFGTERRGIDIPYIKPNFESNVPGLFIAGELGGMGLIRKAAEQGRQAIGSIGGIARGGADLDVVIVGAGPAGIAAGLGAIQRKLKYVMIEQEDALGGTVYHYPRHKIAMTAPVKLPLIGKVKMREITKEALLDFWQGVVNKTGLKIRFNERMKAIKRSSRGFVVETTRGAYTAGAVLLAIGRRGTPRKLGVPGEELPKVVYRLLDTDQYRGKRVLVVGGGDSAVEAALALAAEPRVEVKLSYRGSALSRIKLKNRKRLEEALAKRRVELLLGSNIQSINPASVSLSAGDRNFDVRNDSVIVCAGGELPTELLKQVGIEFETKHGTA